MRYIQFVELDGNGEIIDALGSDGVYIIDARNTIENSISDGMARMAKLARVKPWYIGFRVMQGPRFSDSRELGRWLKS